MPPPTNDKIVKPAPDNKPLVQPRIEQDMKIPWDLMRKDLNLMVKEIEELIQKVRGEDQQAKAVLEEIMTKATLQELMFVVYSDKMEWRNLLTLYSVHDQVVIHKEVQEKISKRVQEGLEQPSVPSPFTKDELESLHHLHPYHPFLFNYLKTEQNKSLIIEVIFNKAITQIPNAFLNQCLEFLSEKAINLHEPMHIGETILFSCQHNDLNSLSNATLYQLILFLQKTGHSLPVFEALSSEKLGQLVNELSLENVISLLKSQVVEENRILTVQLFNAIIANSKITKFVENTQLDELKKYLTLFCLEADAQEQGTQFAEELTKQDKLYPILKMLKKEEINDHLISILDLKDLKIAMNYYLKDSSFLSQFFSAFGNLLQFSEKDKDKEVLWVLVNHKQGLKFVECFKELFQQFSAAKVDGNLFLEAVYGIILGLARKTLIIHENGNDIAKGRFVINQSIKLLSDIADINPKIIGLLNNNLDNFVEEEFLKSETYEIFFDLIEPDLKNMAHQKINSQKNIRNKAAAEELEINLVMAITRVFFQAAVQLEPKEISKLMFFYLDKELQKEFIDELFISLEDDKPGVKQTLLDIGAILSKEQLNSLNLEPYQLKLMKQK